MKLASYEPSSILVRSPNWIGDQVLAYPFFHGLRTLFPKSQITAVCPPWNESLQFRDLVDHVEVLPPPSKPGFLKKWANLEAVASKLSKKKWDFGFALPHSFSSAWLLYRAGVRHRIGYRADARSFLLTHPLKKPSSELVVHRADEYVRLLKSWSTHLQGKEFWGKIQTLDDQEEATSPVPETVFQASKAWPAAHPIEPPEFPYWVIAPGAVAESRRWDLRSFSELAQRVIQETGLSALVVGGQVEAGGVHPLVDTVPGKILDYTARGAPASYWKLFRQARFFIGNDSGLAHLASLSGCAVHVVWGAGDARRTSPIGPGRVTLSVNPVECWPCERNRCSQPAELYRQCLTGLTPESIWEEVSRALRKS